MKDFTVSVRKLTDVELLREACSVTFMGTSFATLLSLYKAEHSPVRTQLFWVKFTNIPLFISTHLIRHHVGSVPFQLTCREDRGGGNPDFKGRIDEVNRKLENLSEAIFYGDGTAESKVYAINDIKEELQNLKENADRYTPVNLALCINAQSLIDMAKLRLCTGCAAPETVIVFQVLKAKIKEVDPDLASMMVRKCVYRNGLCGEPRCCGFNHSQAFLRELQAYTLHFSNQQQGITSIYNNHDN